MLSILPKNFLNLIRPVLWKIKEGANAANFS